VDPKDFPGSWLRVSPVHWEATHNNAMIVAAGEDLNLTDEASRKLCDAFAAFLAEENMQLHYCNAGTWLLLCDTEVPPQTEPLDTALQSSMHRLLITLKKTPFWLRFLTESQMFFSGQPQDDKVMPVNGVWVWPAARPKRMWWRKKKA